MQYRWVRDIESLHLAWSDLVGPRRVLEHDSISIKILERLPLGFPIQFIGWDTLKPGCEHASTTGFPFSMVGQVADQ